MRGAFLITRARRKTDFGANFAYALPTRTKKILVEHKPGSLAEDGCLAPNLGYRPEGLRATFELKEVIVWLSGSTPTGRCIPKTAERTLAT
jgi:hypothetical protein